MTAVAMKDHSSLEKKRVSISVKRQITIPRFEAVDEGIEDIRIVD